MAVFSSPLLCTVGNILTYIYGQDVANEEFRFYEVYNIVLTEILQALDGKGERAPHIRDEVVIAPQFVLKREALNEPINLYGYREDLSDKLALKGQVRPVTASSDADELEEAENFLAEASMEAHHSDEEFSTTIRDIQNTKKTKKAWQATILTEYRIPDFLISHFTSLRGRRTLLFVEIKPDEPLTLTYVMALHDQARLQAGFAFQIFPVERSIFSLMIVGRNFYLKKFDKAFCKVRHHLLTKADDEPYGPGNKKHAQEQGLKVNPRMWQKIFRETEEIW